MWVIVWVSTICTECAPVIQNGFQTELQCQKYRVLAQGSSGPYWDMKGKCVPERQTWPSDFPADQTHRG
jgi:hypothetical protein